MAKKKKGYDRGYATTSIIKKPIIEVDPVQAPVAADIESGPENTKTSTANLISSVTTSTPNLTSSVMIPSIQEAANEPEFQFASWLDLGLKSAKNSFWLDLSRKDFFLNNPVIGKLVLSPAVEFNLTQFVSKVLRVSFGLKDTSPLDDNFGLKDTSPLDDNNQINSMKWTSMPDLVLVYYKLTLLKLDDLVINDILNNCPFITFNEICLWICMNYPSNQLPAGFSDQQKVEARIPVDFVKSSVIFDLEKINEKIPRRLVKSKLTAGEQLKPKDKQAKLGNELSEEQKRYMKTWILEQRDSSSDSESSFDYDTGTKKVKTPQKVSARDAGNDKGRMDVKKWILERSSSSSDSESSFDYETGAKKVKAAPIVVDRETLQSEMNDLMQQVSIAKRDKDKKALKMLGAEIARIKKQDGGVVVDPVPVPISPAKVTSKNDKNELESAENEIFGVFDIIPAESSAPANAFTEYPNIRDMTSSWKGTSPQELLAEYVNKKHPSAKIHYNIIKDREYYASLSIPSMEIKLEMDERVTTKQDARNYIATKCLFLHFSNYGFQTRLPPLFFDLFKEWNRETEDLETKQRKEANAKIYQMLNAVFESRQSIKKQKGVSQEPALKQRVKELFLNRFRAPCLNDWERKSKARAPLSSTRESLPVYTYRSEIIETIHQNQVTIISGETGSGKSTQIPQYLLESAIQSKASCFNLICTQPRRISATSLAKRVSEEQGEVKQGWVGYQVKNDSSICKDTCLTYCTTGVLLQRMKSDWSLKGVTHIVIDECHERTLDSDFLLFLLRDLIATRQDLSLVLMSATANAQLFASYFEEKAEISTVPRLFIPGRTFPVTCFFLEDIVKQINYFPESDSPYINRQSFGVNKRSTMVSGRGGKKYKVLLEWEKVLNHSESSASDDETGAQEQGSSQQYEGASGKKVAKIIGMLDGKKINYDIISQLIGYIWHENPAQCDLNSSRGSIIVFLPGVGEINRLFDLLSQNFTTKNHCPLVILPLHSSLTSSEQSLIFRPTPIGKLKVVLSTNVAETGITIPDAVYVIDTLRARQVGFDDKRGISKLVDTFISKANARQRQGRAGRVKPGFAYRLVPKQTYDNLASEQVAEMRRLPLEEVCLQMRNIVPKSNELSFTSMFERLIEPPPPENVKAAIKLLRSLQALDESDQMTVLGERIGKLPVDARVAKMVLYGVFLGCVDSVLTVAGFLSCGKGPFISSKGKSHLSFRQDQSDILSVLRCFNEWQELWFSGKSQSSIRTWCDSRQLYFENLVLMHESRMQILQSLLQNKMLLGLDLKNFNLTQRYPSTPLLFPAHLDRFSKNLKVITAVFSIAMYPNVLCRSATNKKMLNLVTVSVPGSLTLTTTGTNGTGNNSSNEFRIEQHHSSLVDLESCNSFYFSYNSIKLKNLKSGSGSGRTMGVVFDLNQVDSIIYPLFCSRDLKFNSIQESFSFDENQMILMCKPKIASILLNIRSYLSNCFNSSDWNLFNPEISGLLEHLLVAL